MWLGWVLIMIAGCTEEIKSEDFEEQGLFLIGPGLYTCHEDVRRQRRRQREGTWDSAFIRVQRWGVWDFMGSLIIG